jgi:hypothetical protein
MTQTAVLAATSPNAIAPAPTVALTTEQAVGDLFAAQFAAWEIPTTGGEPSVISGGRTASYGGLVKISHEVRRGDARGAWMLGAKRGDTFVSPADAAVVMARMLDEGRDIFTVTAVRAALGGTTTR